MMPTAQERALGPAFDLLAAYDPADGFFFERRGVGVSATGVAVAIPTRIGAAAAAVREALGTIEGSDRAIAVGSLPFAGAGALAVPARAVLRSGDAGAVEIRVGGDAPVPPANRRSVRSVPHDAFGALQLREVPSADAYARAVASVRDRIRSGSKGDGGAGALRKVVLARTLEVDAARDLDPRQLLARLRAVEPDAYAFAATAGAGTLVGASPELLARVQGRRVASTPLAGSAPRSGDPATDRASADALLASAKDRDEHAVVVEAIAAALRPRCEELAWPAEPELLATANVWHLATPFHGTLAPGGGGVLDVVAALHPTPAVCGTPTAAALERIAEAEPFDRGGYAGPVGWVDANGDGEFAIALRCAELAGSRARLFAGAGIVAGSDPMSEVDETDRKFRAFLDSLRWG